MESSQGHTSCRGQPNKINVLAAFKPYKRPLRNIIDIVLFLIAVSSNATFVGIVAIPYLFPKLSNNGLLEAYLFAVLFVLPIYGILLLFHRLTYIKSSNTSCFLSWREKKPPFLACLYNIACYSLSGLWNRGELSMQMLFCCFGNLGVTNCIEHWKMISSK